ncbi:MAG: EAL domain-containing protein, partial [Actinomycetota bacterium]|nr:EAL domain-containing protein [Actinomycetota bacterium]
MTWDRAKPEQAKKAPWEIEERFRALVQNSSDVIILVEADTTVSYASPAIERVLGYRPEERTGGNILELVHPDDVERAERTLTEILRGSDDPLSIEVRVRHRDGSWRYLETTVTNLLDTPSVGAVVLNYRDVTRRKRAEQDLKESEERYRAVLEESAESIFLCDTGAHRILESNTAFQMLLGYGSEELLGMTVYDFIAHSRDEIDLNVRRDLREKRRFAERKYRRKDGSLVDVEASMTVIPYGGKEVLCTVARDVSERKRLEERLRYQAFHDSLTDLPNRALFLDRLEHAVARASREDGSVAVLLVDLDDFKVINDSLGHDAGNALLIKVAERLRACARPGDTTARLFGDEFALLLEAPVGTEEASRVAERVQERLRAPFDVGGKEVFISSSIGISPGEDGEERPAEALRHADLAMYAAKGRGKAQYEVYDPNMDTLARQRMDLESDLHRAVERGEFEVHYQPVVELRTGKIRAFEALVRWRHPKRGLLAAEEFDLILSIGRWAFEEACRQAKAWRELYPDRRLPVSVNFSANQFSRQAALIPNVLSDIGLDPDGLQLEITERAVMDDAESAIERLRELKSLGVSLTIDDYGMGYSCLYYLKRMPVDALKIDRTFVAGLGKDPRDEAILSGTVGLGHALGLKVVAEGVESGEQLARLREMGCDLAQGYYLGRPLPGAAALKLLEEGA